VASQLTDKEKQLLDANISTRVGLKPYEDGLWGSQGSKDFVHLQLFDESNNLIEFKSVPSSEFSVNASNNNIEFFPGKHIRDLGYQSGTFNVKYNFLRKLAGNEMPVLLHTLQKSTTKVGDVYTNMNAIYVTEDSLVYAATEEDYKLNPTTTEQLAVESLSYQIDIISPSRTEVRLRAKKINGTYQDDFIDIQTSIKLREVINEIRFIGGAVFDTTDLILTNEVGGFLFTQKMLEGTITIPNVFEVDQVSIPVKTGINAIDNPGGENVLTDNLGNLINAAALREWDATLHDDVIRVENWSDGFNGFYSGTFQGTAHLGYHAHWVQGEGKDGGNCIKFPDQNEMFMDLPEWPNEQSNRWLGISQFTSNLAGKGVKEFDIANINMDVRSTVANKGVEVSLRYTGEMATEDVPALPPAGYFNPNDLPPAETIPSVVPEGYVENNSANAILIENQPGNRVDMLTDTYNLLPDMLAVGSNTNIWGGEGAWRITALNGNNVTWNPNLISVQYSKAGALSPEEEWMWDGTAWGVNPAYSSPYPAAPIGTVNPNEHPTAVNSHPYQLEGQGKPYYARNTYRGENFGWQTGTIASLNEDGIEYDVILIKDDLIWRTKTFWTTDNSRIKVQKFDEYFPSTTSDGRGLRDVIVSRVDDTQVTLYQDIFEKGFIQSITRAVDRHYGILSNSYIVFYNNGDKNNNGSPHDDSNRYFYINLNFGVEKLSDPSELDSTNLLHTRDVQIHLLKSIQSGLNTRVIEAGVEKLEVSFNDDRYYIFSGNKVQYIGIGDSSPGFNSPAFIEEGEVQSLFDYGAGNSDGKFEGIPNFGSSAGFPAVLLADYGAFESDDKKFLTYINRTSTQGWYRAGQSEDPYPFQEIFYNAGIKGTSGADLTYGSRNPAADNRGAKDDSDEFLSGTWYDRIEPTYDDGSSQYGFDSNPAKTGTLSPEGLWIWSGDTSTGWEEATANPPRYVYKSPMATRAILAPEIAGEWVNLSVEIPIPADWLLDQKWYFYIYGNARSNDGTMTQGIVWVDNVFVDFTLKDQSVTVPVYKSYSAQITNVSSDGSTISVNKSLRDTALEIGANDNDDDGNPDIVNSPDSNGVFSNFRLSYLNLNQRDLRTYLKFENDLFLTTNFKSDRVAVSEFPYSVVYKLYEPLPDGYEKFDECIVVKEMSDPLEEKVKIIDFVNAEEPKLVLRSPDLNNVESPVQRRETQFKTEAEILTNDGAVSTALRNEFLSQSLDSVEINTDFSRFENFVNFGSSEVRVRNFKTKLEDIEQYKINSASYTGISGSLGDMGTYHHKILDTENKFDRFENYMYFKSSSYISSSIGIFHDNAWPKAGGSGTLSSPYVLAHTTSSQADTWFRNAVNSASLYDENNSSKLSSILPEHIKIDTNNRTYLRFTDMIGQHFDGIWEYINAVTDVTDRRESLSEGISKDLLHSVAKSLGWNLNDGKDLLSLSRYALGKEVTGSAFATYSEVSERDISREIWSRIINNMPFFLKNKGTVRALKGLINIYGIPSTILRVKEYGGPALSDDASPQFEITRKFTKALDFRGGQSVKVAWADDTTSGRKPDTVEFRFRAASGSNQILVEKQDDNDQDWFIRLKDNGSTDNYGQVSFMLSGSAVGKDLGQFKEMTSTSLPIYDGDFYSVMAGRLSGSSNTSVSQSYQLNVGKYDSSRSKIHLYSTSTMDVTQAASSSFSNAWTGSGDIYIGGSGSLDDIGVAFTGSIMEYRHWTEVLNTGSFKNHVANPKAYDGNTVSSSYNNLVLRYSFDDNKDLTSDVEGIRDVSANQTATLSGSHTGFTGNFFRSVVDELKTHIPSIGALRRTTNKIRIEDNKIKPNFSLSSEHRATDSAYDTAPTDSNKVGIWFAPTDVINNDIINSVGNLNFEDFLGDPRDKKETSYRGLENVADNYWKKYTAPNNFWDYIRMIRYYDQSLYPQLRKLIPARAKPDIGLLIEPNIFERPKVVVGKTPSLENTYYSASIDIATAVDGLIIVTGSYNAGLPITNYDAYTGRVVMYSYDSGSSVISSSGEYKTFEASNTEIKDRNLELSIWQRLNQPGSYSNVTMSFGDTLIGAAGGPQVVVSGSRIYGVNQKTMNFYSSVLSSSLGDAHSSSFHNTDTDNFSSLTQGLINSYYFGVKNTRKTTSDGQPPVEVIISAPTKLVTTKGGDSTLKTGDGIVSEFKEVVSKEEKEILKKEEQSGKKRRGKSRGLRKLKKKPQTDQDRKKINKNNEFVNLVNKGGMKNNKDKKEEKEDKDDIK